MRVNEPIILEHENGLQPGTLKVAWTWFKFISVGDRFREVIPNNPQQGETTFLGGTVFTKISETRARGLKGETALFDERKKINFTHPSIHTDTEPHDAVCRCHTCYVRGGR